MLTPEHTADIGIVEDAFGSRQAQRRSGDRHREPGGRSTLPLHRPHRGFARCLSLPAAQSRGIQATQRLVEGGDIADFRVIREQRNHIAASAEHIVGKSLQGLLRPYFHENAGAGGIQRLQTFHKLHGRSDLRRQHVQHLRHNVWTGGIKLAVYVRDDWQPWRLQTQPCQHPTERHTGRSYDLCMESMANRQGHGVVAGFQECFDRLLDCLTRPADHRLAVAVDIGGHYIAVDRLQNPLDFLQWRKHGRHSAVVFERHVGHFAAAGADGFHGVREGQGAGRS